MVKRILTSSVGLLFVFVIFGMSFVFLNNDNVVVNEENVMRSGIYGFSFIQTVFDSLGNIGKILENVFTLLTRGLEQLLALLSDATKHLFSSPDDIKQGFKEWIVKVIWFFQHGEWVDL